MPRFAKPGEGARVDGVLHGFVLLMAVIGAGYLAARLGVVKGDQRKVLNDVSFYIASPPLLFVMVSSSDLSVLLSPVVLAVALSALVVALVYVFVTRVFMKQDLATATLGAASSTYVNSTNLGLPIALYILGDVSYVAPILLVQQVAYSPVIIAILEASRGGGRGARGFGQAALRTIKNPIIIASLLGFVFAIFEISVPPIILDPMSMIGAAAVPMILISFGASLRGQRMLEKGSNWAGVFALTAIKMLIMPLLAWGIAIVLGLGQYETFVAVTFAALPTAQYMYNLAVIYDRAEMLVRDTVLLTTFAAVPLLALVAWLLAV